MPTSGSKDDGLQIIGNHMDNAFQTNEKMEPTKDIEYASPIQNEKSKIKGNYNNNDEPEVMMVTNSLRFSNFNLRKVLEENKQQQIASASSVVNSRQNNHLLDQINHLRHTTYKRIEESFH